MSEFPEDIMKAAEAALDIMLCESSESCGGSEGVRNHAIGTIAAAILAERKRCLAFCNEYVDNVELTGGTMKRFKLDDVNRIAKRAVRYVRDQINGTFDENWKPSSEDAA